MESLSPNLMVENVNKTVDFYCKKLGFDLAMSVPESGEYNWAMITNGNAVIMFQNRESMSDELKIFKEVPIGGSMSLYIRIKNVKDFYKELQSVSEVKIIKKLKTTFYGASEFTVQDNNGYIITFAGEEED